MKIIRKLLVFILGIILSCLIGALLLSFAIKNVIQDELVGGAIKDNFIPMITENSELSLDDQEKIKAILEDKEVEKLVNNMVDEILLTMGTDEGEVSQETFDSIFDYVIQNKAKIEQATGETINIDELEELKNSEEYRTMSEGLSKAINESSSELDDTSKSAIKTYNYLVSNEFRIRIIIGIVLDLLLISLVQWSLYNWLSTLGKALSTSGLTLIILYFGMNLLINTMLTEFEMNLNINTSSVLIMGIVCIVVGISLIIIRKIIDKKVTYIKANSQEIEYNAVS